VDEVTKRLADLTTELAQQRELIEKQAVLLSNQAGASTGVNTGGGISSNAQNKEYKTSQSAALALLSGKGKGKGKKKVVPRRYDTTNRLLLGPSQESIPRPPAIRPRPPAEPTPLPPAAPAKVAAIYDVAKKNGRSEKFKVFFRYLDERREKQASYEKSQYNMYVIHFLLGCCI